jgi:hypothetical protein
MAQDQVRHIMDLLAEECLQGLLLLPELGQYRKGNTQINLHRHR